MSPKHTSEKILHSLLASVAVDAEQKLTANLAGSIARLKSFTEAMAAARLAGLLRDPDAPASTPQPARTVLPPPKKVKD